MRLHHRTAAFAKRIVPTASAFAFDVLQIVPEIRKDFAAFPNRAERFTHNIACLEFFAVQMRAGGDIAVPFDCRKAFAHGAAGDAAGLQFVRGLAVKEEGKRAIYGQCGVTEKWFEFSEQDR